MKSLVLMAFVVFYSVATRAAEPEKISTKRYSEEIVEMFVKTPVDELAAGTDRVRNRILSRQVTNEQLSQIATVVEARVRSAAAGDEKLDFRLSEVQRCFAGKESPERLSGGYGRNREPSGNWRLLIGGFAHGGAKMRDAKCGSVSRKALYGYEVDLQYNAWKSSWHNLWLGVGFSSAPKQKVGGVRCERSDDTGLTGYRGSDLDVEYYELRLMLVPEFRVLERLTIGPRFGVAFDWMTMTGSYQRGLSHPTYSFVNRHYDANYEERELFVQGIIGAQMTWRLFKYIGVYATIDYRGGGSASFLKNQAVDSGEMSFDMDGWQTSCGIFGEF